MKEAVEQLLPYERDLFLALNGSDSLFFDNLMWTFTGRFVWVPILLFLIFMIFRKISVKEGLLTTLSLILLFVLCDQASSGFFKPFFERFRPTHHPDFEQIVDIVNGYRGGLYGFISGHATNSFGLAVFLTLLFKNRWVTIPIFLWAIINSYSRIYLGVHFISDILGGILIGSLIGFLVYTLYAFVRKRYFKVPQEVYDQSVYPAQNAKTIGIVMLSYILLIILFSQYLAGLPH